jgi:hypothetical protein
MLGWLAELFQPIVTAIMSLLVWLGIVSPHKDVSVGGGSAAVSENVLPESGQYVGVSSLEKPSEEVPAPSNE